MNLCFFLISMKYINALEYVLQNAPIRGKDPDKKVTDKLENDEKETFF